MTYQVNNLPEGALIKWREHEGCLIFAGGRFYIASLDEQAEIPGERWVEVCLWPHEIARKIAPTLVDAPQHNTTHRMGWQIPYDTVVRRSSGQIAIVGQHGHAGSGDEYLPESIGWTLERKSFRFDLHEPVEVLSTPAESAALYLNTRSE